MPAPLTAEQFLDLTRKSGLLDRQDLDAYLQRRRAAGPLPDGARALAEALVRDGMLTRFQAEQLLQGRWREFILNGKYRVLGPLGSGGMGQVFLCEHQVMRRRVAVKVLPGRSGDPVALERFRREARAVAQLDHPNIVGGHDIDQHGTLHFLVMEYVDGSNFQAIVARGGPLDPLRAAHYVRQAALGLQHAHEAGLVHRDVKPANLLLDRAGTVKVLDLGLARFFHDEADDLSRRDGAGPLGTGDYMAPEQALDSHRVDIRADVYSLGATFYFLLAGTGPFQGGAVQKLMRHQFARPRPIREVRPDVPEGLAAVLDRMMAKDPARRYQTPAEVVEALAPWARAPIPPPPPEEMPGLVSRGPGKRHAEAASDLPAFLYGPVPARTPSPPPGGPAPFPDPEPPTVPFPDVAAETLGSASTPGLGPGAAPRQSTLPPPAVPGEAGAAPRSGPLFPPSGGGSSRPPRSAPGWRRRWAVLAAAVLLLGAAGAIAFLVYKADRGPPGGPPPASDAGPRPLRLLVPAYFYPAGEGLEKWDRVIDSPAAAVTVAIVNPDSGPGKEADPNYARALTRARQKGVTVIGYVSTKYAARPLPEVRADVDRWALFYPAIQGIFFDEQPATADHVPYYADLYKHARQDRGLSLVVTNPGTVCAEQYLARPASDVVCLVEVTRDFSTYRRPAWAKDYPAERFAALLYEVESPARMKDNVLEMRDRQIGNCFITDAKQPNPWDRLPRYWEEEVEAVQRVNAR